MTFAAVVSDLGRCVLNGLKFRAFGFWVLVFLIVL